jgi:competence ComEA-like helix-hairpin-helix protein
MSESREERRARLRALRLDADEARRVIAVAVLVLFTFLPSATRALAARFGEGSPPPLTSCTDRAVRASDGKISCAGEGAPVTGLAGLLMGVRIDLNHDDADALEIVPGIGPAKARAIILDRAARGPFGSVAEVERVRGIGPKLAAKIAAYATVR